MKAQGKECLMAILRAFLIFSLFTQLALANQTCQSSSAQSFSFSRIEIELYKEQIADASKKLNLTEEIFLTRLEKNKLSLAKFFEYVDSYKKSPNESFQSFVLNPYKVLESIRLRGVNNPNFLFSFISLATFHSLSQIGGHFLVDTKLEYVPLLGAQLTALLITEVALNFGSAKNAAYLVAYPESLNNIKNFEQTELSSADKKQINEIRGNFKKLFQFSKKMSQKGIDTTKKIFRDGLKQFPQLFQVASLAGLVSFAGLKFYVEGGLNLERDLEYILVNAGFHASFISVWSNFRYQLMQGQIFPALGKSEFWSRHPVARSLAIWTTTGVNLSLAVLSYSAGSIYVNELFEVKSISLEDL
tara:strand:- start:33231 stop:34307 length:1077 start_codon:yes stop_codon:yes gene_type:complete